MSTVSRILFFFRVVVYCDLLTFNFVTLSSYVDNLTDFVLFRYNCYSLRPLLYLGSSESNETPLILYHVAETFCQTVTECFDWSQNGVPGL